MSPLTPLERTQMLTQCMQASSYTLQSETMRARLGGGMQQLAEQLRKTPVNQRGKGIAVLEKANELLKGTH